MASLGRSSAMIAAGTMISRVTGLIRSVMLVAVLGSVSQPANAFATSNALPNAIFAVLSAGLLTAVFVPQIVKAARHEDGGSAFVSKLFTLGTVTLVIVAGVATFAAPVLVQLYAPDWPADQYAMAVTLAYWCIPQLLFYGLFALIGEALNARNVYGPYTWAPIANNVISIAGFAVFILLFETPLTSTADWTPDRIALLGAIATGGVVVQFLILTLFWRRAKLPLRPDFRWRGVGLAEPIRLAGWTFLMVVVGQAAGWVQTVAANSVSPDVPGNAVIQYAWLVFMLPYSVIVLSIGTPYFTRISEHAAHGRTAELRRDIDASIRTLGVFIVIATAVLFAAATPATRIFSATQADAIKSAPVLLAFLVGLIPIAMIFIIQRTFYAYGDTRTPFFFTVLQGIIVVVFSLIALHFVDDAWRSAVIAGGQSIATVIQTIVAIALLRRRVGPLGIRSWGGAHLRFIVAAIPAGAAGYLVFQLSGGDTGWMVPTANSLVSPMIATAGVALIGVVGLVVYVLMLALLRAPELRFGIDAVRRVIRR